MARLLCRGPFVENEPERAHGIKTCRGCLLSHTPNHRSGFPGRAATHQLFVIPLWNDLQISV